MLEEQFCMDYSKELEIEWRQARDEGKDVADLNYICELISTKSFN